MCNTPTLLCQHLDPIMLMLYDPSAIPQLSIRQCWSALPGSWFRRLIYAAAWVPSGWVKDSLQRNCFKGDRIREIAFNSLIKKEKNIETHCRKSKKLYFNSLWSDNAQAADKDTFALRIPNKWWWIGALIFASFKGKYRSKQMPWYDKYHLFVPMSGLKDQKDLIYS